MSVIVELSVPAVEFQLGRILSTEGDTTVSLETMVPLGGQSVPLFRVIGSERPTFETQVRDHHTVDGVHVVNTHGEETLYALDWEISEDTFLDGVAALGGHVLEATGGADAWTFQLRFPSHHALSGFQKHCHEFDLHIDVRSIYNPTRPDAGPWYGLTGPQRETLAYAAEAGYYDIPRRVSTQDIAEEFDISDQAVTERLRRAIDTLVANTLVLTADESPPEAGDPDT